MFKKFILNGKKKQIDNDELLICNIIRKLAPRFKFQTLEHDTRFDSLGLNSIAFVEFLIKIGESTKINLEEIVTKVDISSIETIGDMANVLRSFKKV